MSGTLIAACMACRILTFAVAPPLVLSTMKIIQSGFTSSGLMPRAALSSGSASLGSVSANRYCPLITPATLCCRIRHRDEADFVDDCLALSGVAVGPAGRRLDTDRT